MSGKIFVILGLVALGTAQQGITTIDPEILLSVFGSAPTTTSTSPSTTRLEDITVKPTEGTQTFVNENGQKCRCVPYYLCNDDKIGININNASITGWGELDIRFGEEDCQESVEICCTYPKNTITVPTQKPEPVLPRGCGYRNRKGISVTITGGNGNEAQFGEFPWVIALLDKRNISYAGVGVLIHPQVVMTTAHIATRFDPADLKIRAGEWDTQTIKEYLEFQERDVVEIYSHQEFSPRSLKNDIALLRLDAPVQLAEHINVICLPHQDETFDFSTRCVANGWGKDVFGLQGRYAVILKQVEVNMVPYNRCNMLLKRTKLGNNFRLHNSFVCAGGEEGKDTCQGDGGAPLVCPIDNDRYKLTGLVAWGIGCGQKDVPGVYASVSSFRNWVDEKMLAWGFDTSGSRV